MNQEAFIVLFRLRTLFFLIFHRNFVPRKNQLKLRPRSLSPVQTDSNADTPTVPSPAGSPGLSTSQIIESNSAAVEETVTSCKFLIFKNPFLHLKN